MPPRCGRNSGAYGAPQPTARRTAPPTADGPDAVGGERADVDAPGAAVVGPDGDGLAGRRVDRARDAHVAGEPDVVEEEPGTVAGVVDPAASQPASVRPSTTS